MPKTRTDTVAVYDSISRAEAIRQRQSEISLELQPLSNIPELARLSSDAKGRLDSFIRTNGATDSSLSPQKLATLRELKESAERAQAKVAAATGKEKTLRNELAALQEGLEGLDCTARLDEVLQHQAKILEAEGSVATLVAAIADQESLIQQNGPPPSGDLNQKRQQLLADMALGSNVTTELEQVDRELQLVQEQAQAAEIRRNEAKQVIAGLNQRLTEAKTLLESLHVTGKSIHYRYLRGEAEAAGAEYVRAASELIKTVQRLYALDELMKAFPENGRFSLLQGRSKAVMLPTFALKAIPASPGADGVYYYGHKENVSALAAAEKQRLYGVGVEL